MVTTKVKSDKKTNTYFTGAVAAICIRTLRKKLQSVEENQE
jgi:hypothetical protein